MQTTFGVVRTAAQEKIRARKLNPKVVMPLTQSLGKLIQRQLGTQRSESRR